MKGQDVAVKIVLCLFLALPVQACYYLQSDSTPLRTLFYSHTGATNQTEPAKELLVLLPGIRDYPEYFQQHEFIDVLHARHMPVDVLAVNAHYRYYARRSLLQRLKEDVVDPAFAQGYQRIHFMGVSLGGYGALLYMREYPDDLSCVILLAPYLGEPQHYEHLIKGGEAASAVLNDAANIWPWFVSLDQKNRSRIYLGYGRGDTYAESHQLLSSYLSNTQVMVIDGDHRWATWQRLWPRLLTKTKFPADAFVSFAGESERLEP